MLISVIDYTGNYISKEVLPSDPLILIVCDEFCLAPDTLNASNLPDLDYSQLHPGIHILRIPNDLYRGVIYGHILSIFPSSKLYTSRPDIFSSYIPAQNLFFQHMPYKLITYRLPDSEKLTKELNGNSIFNEIYEESFKKFVKMYLLDKSIRTVKAKSLRSQLKNLIEGIVTSFRKKIGNFGKVDFDGMVEEILCDLESHGVLMCRVNVEYYDRVIDEYFGKGRCREFVPGYKSGMGETRKDAEGGERDDFRDRSMASDAETVSSCLG